jgi:hypothetical protein
VPEPRVRLLGRRSDGEESHQQNTTKLAHMEIP